MHDDQSAHPLQQVLASMANLVERGETLLAMPDVGGDEAPYAALVEEVVSASVHAGATQLGAAATASEMPPRALVSLARSAMEAGARASWVLDPDPRVRQARALLQRASDARDLGRLEHDPTAQRGYVDNLVAEASAEGFTFDRGEHGHVNRVDGENRAGIAAMVGSILDQPRGASGASTYGEYLYILASGVAHGLPWAWIDVGGWKKPRRVATGAELTFEEEMTIRVLIAAFNLWSRSADGLLQLRGNSQLEKDAEWNRLLGELQVANDATAP